jgi:sarcosine oxidase / L-pipecolate oxidase
MGRVVIVGAGVFGVSSALALRSRDVDVTLLDPGPIPNPEAASNDISKIVRMDYGADISYTELMERALPVWAEWNARWGVPLYHPDGFLLLSRSPLARATFEGESYATLTSRGHALERLDEGAIARRWPAWIGGRYVDGYFNPAAGWVESGRVVSRMFGDAVAAGVHVRTGEGFSRLIETGARVSGVVTRSGERIAADVVIVAAGAWTPVLLPHLARAMWPVAQPVFHLKPPDPQRWRPPRFTVWAADIAATGWYGFPANADGIVKIAHHGPGRRVDPDARRATTPADEAALRVFLRDSLPGLADLPLHASKTCLYCDSFDGDFWIGADPERPGLVVAAGDSGHGFKFAPVIGEIVADAVDGKVTAATRRFGWRDPIARRTERARFGMS